MFTPSSFIVHLFMFGLAKRALSARGYSFAFLALCILRAYFRFVQNGRTVILVILFFRASLRKSLAFRTPRRLYSAACSSDTVIPLLFALFRFSRRS